MGITAAAGPQSGPEERLRSRRSSTLDRNSKLVRSAHISQQHHFTGQICPACSKPPLAWPNAFTTSRHTHHISPIAHSLRLEDVSICRSEPSPSGAHGAPRSIDHTRQSAPVVLRDATVHLEWISTNFIREMRSCMDFPRSKNQVERHGNRNADPASAQTRRCRVASVRMSVPWVDRAWGALSLHTAHRPDVLDCSKQRLICTRGW